MKRIVWFVVGTLLFSCGLDRVKHDKIKTSREWYVFDLPDVDGKKVNAKKIVTNQDHAFISYEIGSGDDAISGLFIKDKNNKFSNVDLSPPMNGENMSADGRGFVGKITALHAVPRGAWLATFSTRPSKENTSSLVAKIENSGRFENHWIKGLREIVSIIPLKKGLLTLEFFGVNTPVFYEGDAIESPHAIDFNKFVVKDSTTTELGDAAVSMLYDEARKPPLVAASLGGLFKGELAKKSWDKEWASDSYADLHIFPGGPNAMAFYRGRLAIGSFTSPYHANRANGFLFCDLNDDTAKNPCEKPESLRARDYEIKAMVVVNEKLYMASTTGLLVYDDAITTVFRRSTPSSQNDAATRVVVTPELPDDNIVDIAASGDTLWLLTKNSLVKWQPPKTKN